MNLSPLSAPRRTLTLLSVLALLLVGVSPAAHAATGVVSGTVSTEDGGSLAITEISLFEEWGDGWSNTYKKVRVAEDGSYRLEGLEVGRRHVLWINTPSDYGFGYVGPGYVSRDVNDVVVLTKSTSGVDVVLERYRPLTGTVDPGLGEPDKVWCWTQWFGRGSFTEWGGSTPVEDDGSFELASLFPRTPCKLELSVRGSSERLYWTSDYTLPTGDFEKAGTTLPRADLRFPDRNYLVALTPPRVTGAVRAGNTVTATPGTWTSPSPRLSYQWLRDGKPVQGATKASYTLAAADIGSRLVVRVSASAVDFVPGSATSAATAVVPTVAPRVTAKLVSKGTSSKKLKVKVTVKAPGVTSKPLGTITVRFGSTSKSFALKAGHRGTRTLSVKRPKATGTLKVSFTPSGSSARTLRAAKGSTKVAKVKAKISAKPKRSTIKRSARAKVTVKVSTPLTKKPTGTLRLTVGKVSRTVTLGAKDKGKVTVTLPRLGKGKHSVRASFTPGSSWKKYLKKSSSTKSSLRVR